MTENELPQHMVVVIPFDVRRDFFNIVKDGSFLWSHLNRLTATVFCANSEGHEN